MGMPALRFRDRLLEILMVIARAQNARSNLKAEFEIASPLRGSQ